MSSKKVFASAVSFQALAIGSILPALAGSSVFLAAPALAQVLPVPGVPVPPVPGVPLPPVPGVPVPPVVVPTPPATSGAIDITNSTDPIAVTLADGFVSNGPINLSTIGDADINVV